MAMEVLQNLLHPCLPKAGPGIQQRKLIRSDSRQLRYVFEGRDNNREKHTQKAILLNAAPPGTSSTDRLRPSAELEEYLNGNGNGSSNSKSPELLDRLISGSLASTSSPEEIKMNLASLSLVVILPFAKSSQCSQIQQYMPLF